jgi:hypothetical protein
VGSGGGIGLGSGNVGPAIASAKMRAKCKRSSDKILAAEGHHKD